MSSEHLRRRESFSFANRAANAVVGAKISRIVISSPGMALSSQKRVFYNYVPAPHLQDAKHDVNNFILTYSICIRVYGFFAGHKIADQRKALKMRDPFGLSQWATLEMTGRQRTNEERRVAPTKPVFTSNPHKQMHRPIVGGRLQL